MCVCLALCLCSTFRVRLVGKQGDLVKRSVRHVHCEYLVTLRGSEGRHSTTLPSPPLPSPPLPSQVAYLQSTAQQLKDLSKQVKSLPDPAKQAVKWFNEHAMKM